MFRAGSYYRDLYIWTYMKNGCPICNRKDQTTIQQTGLDNPARNPELYLFCKNCGPIKLDPLLGQPRHLA